MMNQNDSNANISSNNVAKIDNMVCVRENISVWKIVAQTLQHKSGNNNTFPRSHPVHSQMDLFWENSVGPWLWKYDSHSQNF